MKQKAKLVTGLIIGFLAAIGLDQWTKLLADVYKRQGLGRYADKDLEAEQLVYDR